METKKTRSSQLTPLSAEHREGMLFLNRIREALDQVSIERLRSYTLWYWKNHIKPHFYQEEKILLPYMPADHPLALKLQDDHAYIRDLILSLDQDADKQSFRSLCDLLDSHIRFEEREVFSYLEQNLSENQLNTIHTQLETHPVTAEEWKDLFWNAKQPA
jgi:hemerythrin-like domain-containing protein